MDDAIEQNLQALAGRTHFVSIATVEDYEPLLREASAILRWRKTPTRHLIPEKLFSEWVAEKKVFEVDPVNVRYEGSFYIDAALHFVPDKSALIRSSKEKMECFAADTKKYEQGYVIATGPSSANYHKFDFNNSFTVVCNSVILDQSLMHEVKPQVLVFADPIFHFGPSEYAGQFRKSLLRASKIQNFTICIPFKYYPLFIAAMPELEPRTIGIPFVKDRDWNFDIANEFEVKTTANILTFLMLPMATTFARQVGIIGCDGRPLEDDSYFWNHNKQVQINDKMENIKSVHPGFFNIDYQDYYLGHCQTLSEQLAQADQTGYSIKSLTFSHIPALKDRFSREFRLGAPSNLEKRPSVIIIDTDVNSKEGHFLPYIKRLSESLADAAEKIDVLTRLDLEVDIGTAIQGLGCDLHRVFSSQSWDVACSDSAFHQRKFTTEILDVLPNIVEADEPTVLYMYCGSFEHAAALSEVTAAYGNIHAHVNLFWAAGRNLNADSSYVHEWRDFLQWVPFAEPRLKLSVPTETLSRTVFNAFGVKLEVAPHPCVAMPDSVLRESQTSPRSNESRSQKVVFFPGTSAVGKGYELTQKYIELIKGDRDTLHVLRRPKEGYTGFLVGDFTDSNVEIIDAHVSDSRLRELFEVADVVVLPYEPNAFEHRTSGALIDALAYGVPVVVIEGTWLAGLVSTLGNGVIVPNDDPKALKNGVSEVLNNVSSFRIASKHAAEQFFSENCWQGLAEFILNPLTSKTNHPKTLVIDLTSFDGISATGRVKEAFFATWPIKRLKVLSLGDRSRGLYNISNKCGAVEEEVSLEGLLKQAASFAPDIIYYRAVEDRLIHAAALALIDKLGTPYVIHIMDDWPRRLSNKNPEEFKKIDGQLRGLFHDAAECLSISDEMSEVFSARYGREFTAFANAIDPASFPPKTCPTAADSVFQIVYCGALASDMTAKSIYKFAETIESLPSDLNVKLKIYTREPWLSEARNACLFYSKVEIEEQVPAAGYYETLQKANALLLAYNFDEASKSYIGLSLANKLPEYLASGTPIIAYGPAELPTIACLLQDNCGLVLTEENLDVASAELEQFIRDPESRRVFGSRARRMAFSRHNKAAISGQFADLMSSSTSPPAPRNPVRNLPLMETFPRSSRAHCDETNCIAALFSNELEGSIMIDVGAHHGSAMLPFLKLGWEVIAFEPDSKNRRRLRDQLEQQTFRQKVTLDERCVSNYADENVSFYSSEVSTGISGLSAFHDSHSESQSVAVTSLTSFFESSEMPSVDFLKIDTEGHDLFVLEGYPWHRNRPKVIECEFENTKTLPLGYDFDDLALYLLALGYTVFVSEWHPIIRYGIRHDWHRLTRYPCKLNDDKGWGNLLAFRDPIADSAVVRSFSNALELTAASAPLDSSNTLAHERDLALVSSSKNKPFTTYPVSTHQNFNKVGSNSWVLKSPVGNNCYWTASRTSEDFFFSGEFKAILRLQSDTRCTVKITLGRHGKSEFEGCSSNHDLQEGVDTHVILEKKFDRQHRALKIQLEVISKQDSDIKLTIDDLLIFEAPSNLESRCSDAETTLRIANRALRRNMPEFALSRYLTLLQRNTKQMYLDNCTWALKAAKISENSRNFLLSTVIESGRD
ncbi:FkbM family methyltransferase [Luminiphilus sp.]|nr:FkbM family methyltransferase [Luminiphilus sp.]MDA9711253.1 FkbM family methyltransferase [Luminiphilus sp.]